MPEYHHGTDDDSLAALPDGGEADANLDRASKKIEKIQKKTVADRKETIDRLRKKSGKTSFVKRGSKTPNTWASPQNAQFYGFLSRFEGPPDEQDQEANDPKKMDVEQEPDPQPEQADDGIQQHCGPWHLRLECTPRAWMEQAWATIAATEDGTILQEFLGTSTFEEAYRAADGTMRDRVAAVWDRFLTRFRSKSEGPELYIFEMLLDRRHSELRLDRLSCWFFVDLVTGNTTTLPGDDAPTGIFVSADEALPPERAATLTRAQLVPEAVAGPDVPQGVLQALHFPHTRSGGPAPDDGLTVQRAEPDIDDAPNDGNMEIEDAPVDGKIEIEDAPVDDKQVEDADDDFDAGLYEDSDARDGRKNGPQSISQCVATVLRLLRTAVRWLRDALLPRELHWAVTGTGGLQWPVQSPVEYRGSPATVQGGHLANTMSGPVQNGQQPFVGIIDIGQGCCSVLMNGAGRAEVYFDFGYSVRRAFDPLVRPQLCFCHDPMIILSHWDFDHFRMSRMTADANGLRWLAPQQRFGGPANRCIAAVRDAGGEMMIWNAPQGYMPFGWGFLERCTGGRVNNSGLAAWVCVRDDPANGPAQGNPQIGVAGLGGIGAMLPTGGALDARDVATAARAAQNPASLAVQCVAAALGASRYFGLLNYRRRRAAVQACATAAIAVDAALAANPQLQPHGAVQVLPARFAQQLGRELNRCATAILNACVAAANVQAPTPRRLATAAATAFAAVRNAVAPATRRRLEQIIESAIRNEPRPDVYNQPAPLAAGERYVLLTGDANFSHIPSTAQTPPVPVAVLAMHHGSNMSDGEFLDSNRIPLAPGSDAEQVANRTIGRNMVTYAMNAAGTGAGQRRAVVNAAIAAAAAVLATLQQRRRGRERARWAVTAAAATAAAARNAGPMNFRLIALAAIIAYEMTPDTLATWRVVLTAQQLLGPNQPNPRESLRGACHVRVEQNVLGAANALAAGPNNLAGAFAAARYAQNAALVAIATNAVTAVAALRRRGGLAGAPALQPVANAARQVPAQRPLFDGPRSNAAAARMAATHAAIAIASARAAAVQRRDPEVIENAVRAVAGGRVIPPNPGAGPQNATVVCFPFGVQLQNNVVVHAYPSRALGGFGHPHPLAIAKYRSKGWTTGWNACAKIPPAGVLNWSGHIALGWDAVNDAPVQNQQIAFNCPVCNRALNFNC